MTKPFQIVGLLVALLTFSISTGGNAMAAKPEMTSITIICSIDAAELAPEFANALCPAFAEAVAEKWPEKSVAVVDDVAKADQDANNLLLGLNAVFKSDSVVDASLNWGSASTETSHSDVMTLQVAGRALGVAMVNHLVRDLLKMADPFATK